MNQFVSERIQKHIKNVNTLMVEALENCPPVLAPVMEHLKAAEGKYVRAALIVATAESLGKVSDRIISLACATELLHLATLVHDDVIDDAELRRGITSIQAQFGKKMAVIAGDYLFTKCFKLVSEKNKEHMEYFSDAISAICIGETLQHQFNNNLDISKKQYYKIIMGKTAAMFAMALLGAADAAGAEREISLRLGRAGYYMGMVFQMIDDCLDYEGDARDIKKSVCKDIEQGVITYPLIYTLKQRPELKDKLKGGIYDAEVLAEVVTSVRECGGVKATRREAKYFYDLSKKKLNMSLPSDSLLFGMLDFVYKRSI